MDDGDATCRAGIAAARQGALDQARACALALSGDDDRVARILRAARAANGPQEALRLARGLLDQLPESAPLQLQAAALAAAAALPETVLDHCLAALIAAPGDPWVARAAAHLLAAAGRISEATKILEAESAEAGALPDLIALHGALHDGQHDGQRKGVHGSLRGGRRGAPGGLGEPTQAFPWPDDPQIALACACALAARGAHRAACQILAPLRLAHPEDAEIALEDALCHAALGHKLPPWTQMEAFLERPEVALRVRRILVARAVQAHDWPRLAALVIPVVSDPQQGVRPAADPEFCLAFLAIPAPSPPASDAVSDYAADPLSPAALARLQRACLQHLLGQAQDLTGMQLWRLVRRAEGLGDAAAARAAIAGLLARPRLPLAAVRALMMRLAATQPAASLQRIGAWLGRRLSQAERHEHAVDVARLTEGHTAALALWRHQVRAEATRTPSQAALLGQLLVDTGQAPLALRYLLRALRRWPEAVALVDALCHAALGAGQPDTALAVLDRLRAGPMGSAAPWAERAAHVLHQAGRPEDAFALLEGLDDEARARLLPWRLSLALALNDPATIARLGQERRLRLRHDPAGAIRVRTALKGFELMQHALEQRCQATSGSTAEGKSVDRDDIGAGIVQSGNPADLWYQARAVIDAFMQDPPPDRSSGPAGQIPRKIMQYWHRSPPPAEVAGYMASWRGAAGFVHHRLDLAAARRFLVTRLGPDWVAAFDAAREPAAACDFFRLCWLGLEGGVYADADDRLIGDLGALVAREAGAGLLLYREPTGAIANNFIVARPGHPLILHAALAARDALARREWEGAWQATGPGLMTRMVARYLRDGADPAGPPDLRILPQAALRPIVQIHLPLCYKLSAGYWANRGRPGAPDYRDLFTEAMNTDTGSVTPHG